MEDLQDPAVTTNPHFIKRKRTKRLKPSSPLTLALTAAAAAASTSSGSESGDRGFNPSMASSTSSEFAESVGKEDEDMANCLILLARGLTEKSSDPAAIGGAVRSSYECKTCNRCFPSFQALGGHRASHRKPKTKSPETMEKVVDHHRFSNIAMNTTLSLQIQSKFKKFHECSICGAEFSSGQALGGHMRRHRPFAVASTSSTESEIKKSRNYPELDLNLPAPEDNHRESEFSFTGKDQVIIFSASPLVDCHY